MSDAGAIGVIIHDIAEIFSKKYYAYDDNNKAKSYIGFNLIFLKDLVNIIQKEENIDLFLEHDLNDIIFFKNEEAELKYLQKNLL